MLGLASSKPTELADRYVRLFRELGVAEAQAIPIASRLDANNLKFVRAMEDISGVFFTGGNQVSITSILGGTEFSRSLKAAYIRGATIAGTSAGASAISRHMIMTGTKGVSPQKGMVSIAARPGADPQPHRRPAFRRHWPASGDCSPW